MIDTQNQLQQVFADNFMAYFRSQVAHVNVMGRNFYSDHRLLGKIYQHLQQNIDVLAEHLRSIGDFMPVTLDAVLTRAQISDEPCLGTADDLLEQIRSNLVELVSSFSTLAETASDDDIEEIENYAQEEILVLNRYIWMLDSTLTSDTQALQED
jgi:starvation-inducible DNA-binding protein